MCVTNQVNRVTVSTHFPTMSVTYQVNYFVKFSDNVCDISGQLYHTIIPFSDNVCDIRGQLNCQRKKMGGKRTEKITAVTVTNTTLPVNCLTATDCNAAACAYFLTLEVWIVFKLFFLFPIEATHNFSVSSFAKLAVYLVGWVASCSFKFSYFLTMCVTYQVYIREQSLVVSIETKKVIWTQSKFDSKNI